MTSRKHADEVHDDGPNKRRREDVEARIAVVGQEQALFSLLLDVAAQSRSGTIVRVAGGWVRDKLLQKSNKDIDIVVDNMSGLQFAQIIDQYRVQRGGRTAKIGVIQANPEQSKHLETATMTLLGKSIDFVNLRKEEYSDDSRIPAMAFGSPAEDALRRDFTINALFYNINRASVEDFTGLGCADLRAGLIRTPLDPCITFMDDPLRVLRAIRFASRFGFKLVPELQSAMGLEQVKNALMSKVKRERVGTELAGILNEPLPQAVHGLSLLHNHRYMGIVFRMPSASKQDSSAAPSKNTHRTKKQQQEYEEREKNATSSSSSSILVYEDRTGEIVGVKVTCSNASASSNCFVGLRGALAAQSDERLWDLAYKNLLRSVWLQGQQEQEGEDQAQEQRNSQAQVRAPGCLLLHAVSCSTSVTGTEAAGTEIATTEDHQPKEQAKQKKQKKSASTASAANTDQHHQRVWLLSAVLQPMAALEVTSKKGRQVPLSSVVLKDGMKFSSKEAEDVAAVLLASVEWNVLVDTMFPGSSDNTVAAKQDTTEAERPPLTSEDRRNRRDIGLLLCKVKAWWRVGLQLCCAAQLSGCVVSGAGPGGDADAPAAVSETESAAMQTPADLTIDEKAAFAIISRHSSMAKAVCDLGLDGVWDMRPLMTGKQVMDFLSIKKSKTGGGPVVGQLMKDQIAWQLENPSGQLEQCKLYLQAQWEKLRASAEAKAEAAAKAQESGKAKAKAKAKLAKAKAAAAAKRKDSVTPQVAAVTTTT